MTSETTAADDGYLELRALKAGKKPHQNVEKPVPSGLRGGAGRAHSLPPGALPTSPSSVTEVRGTHHREASTRGAPVDGERLLLVNLRAVNSERAAVEVARRLLDDRRRRFHGLLGGVELLPEFGQVRAALEVGN